MQSIGWTHDVRGTNMCFKQIDVVCLSTGQIQVILRMNCKRIAEGEIYTTIPLIQHNSFDRQSK